MIAANSADASTMNSTVARLAAMHLSRLALFSSIIIILTGCGTTNWGLGGDTAIRVFYASTSEELSPGIPRAIAGFPSYEIPAVALGQFKSTDRIKICTAVTWPVYRDLAIVAEDGRVIIRQRWSTLDPSKGYFRTTEHIDPRGDPAGVETYVTLKPLPAGRYRATLDIGNGAVETIRFEVAY